MLFRSDDSDFNVNFLDATSHTPLGKIDDVLIMVNGNYVPIDFYCYGS